MTTSNALIPVESFLPSRSDSVGQWLDHYPNSDQSRKDALIQTFTPVWGEGNYGPDGEEVMKTTTGDIIDIYA